MKRVASIAVLLIFLANTMGYYLIYSYCQYVARQEMMIQIRQGLLHPDLVVLRVIRPETDKTFRRTGNHEISLHDRMYDVIAEHRSGDTVWFYGLHDRKEERLVAGYRSYQNILTKAEGNRHGIPVSILVKNLVTQALVQMPDSPPQMQENGIQYPDRTPALVPAYLVPVAPPPKQA